jgi:beta-carotene 15,15'-dioxygenase
MIRVLLIISGITLLLLQQYIEPFSTQLQFTLFLIGIILLGVPHGAADLLVATQNSEIANKKFSKLLFFTNYLGRLFLFAAIIWFLPLVGNLLFIIFAAYHFGETDLYQFKINNISGKLFVISYGLVILGVILLHHFEEVKPLFLQFKSGEQYVKFLNWLDAYRYTILSVLGALFFASTFFYFAINKLNQQIKGEFLIQFAFIVFILYNLPMITGFTFYFIVWHSLLSLRNIVNYLQKDGSFSALVITKQIGLYSLIAILGIGLFGLTGFMFVNNNSIVVYVFLGLAVLTAPHMQVMHSMYNSIRSKNTF